MRRQQHDQLVARAIVAHEVSCLRSGTGAVLRGGPFPSLTVPDLIAAYGMDWATYHATDGRTYGRAEQLIRNCLNEQWHEGTLCKVRRWPQPAAGHGNLLLKEGRWVVFGLKGEVPFARRITPTKEST